MATSIDKAEAEIRASVEAYRAKTGTRGLALSAILEGRHIASIASGEADAAGRPMAAETRFAAGSITKTFAALAFLILEREGALSLDDPVSRYVPGVDEKVSFVDPPPGGKADALRLRHLLSHTSGIPELGYAVSLLFRLCGAEGQGPYRPDDPAGLLAGLASAARDRLGAPGTRFMYSNENFVLLAAAAEAATGQGFADIVASRVLEPLGMADSSIGLGRPGGTRIADGFVPGPSGLRRVEPAIPKAVYGPGGLVTTVDDLGLYLSFLQGSGGLGGEGADYYGRRMWRGVLGRDGFPGLSYGLGWYIEEGEFDEPLVYHGGDVLYSGGIVALLPRRRLGVAVGQNAAGSQALGALARAALRALVDAGLGGAATGAGRQARAVAAASPDHRSPASPDSAAESADGSVAALESLVGLYLTRDGVYELEAALVDGALALRPRIPGAGWAPWVRLSAASCGDANRSGGEQEGAIASFAPAGTPRPRGPGCEFYRTGDALRLRYDNCLFTRRAD